MVLSIGILKPSDYDLLNQYGDLFLITCLFLIAVAGLINYFYKRKK
jgi:hypothetical protein